MQLPINFDHPDINLTKIGDIRLPGQSPNVPILMDHEWEKYPIGYGRLFLDGDIHKVDISFYDGITAAQQLVIDKAKVVEMGGHAQRDEEGNVLSFTIYELSIMTR